MSKRFASLVVFTLLASTLSAEEYFVATNGNDSSSGTSLDAPFRTIQHAIDLANPGSTVFVRQGVYREAVVTPRSGTQVAPITIRNYQEETVTVSGADVIEDSWTLVGNEVYRAPMPWNYHFENESNDYNSNHIFHNGIMLELARWPNQTSSDLVAPTLALADSVTFASNLATFHEADFTEIPDRWVGAKIWVNLSRNGADGQGQTGTVVSAQVGQITVSGIDTRGGNGAWGIGTGTEFYLFQPTLDALNRNQGIEAALDRGEWYLDATAQQLYVRTPNGQRPSTGSIEAKRRTYGFNFDGDSHIILRGIGLFGTSLTTDNLAMNRNYTPGGVAAASNILIDGMNALYVSHFNDLTGNYQMQWSQKSGLILSGDRIVFQRGLVRYSSGSGISMIGKNGKILNSVFRDLNFSVSEAGMVNFGKTYDPTHAGIVSLDHEFGYNTLFNTPQKGINFVALKNSTENPLTSKARIHHNLVHDVMLRSYDSAAIDSVSTNHQFIRIDHNVIYNLQGERRYGIYFDFAAQGVVDHNVIYNVTRPININWDPSRGAQSMWVLNNLCISDLPGGAGLDTGALSSEGSIIRNNILSNGIWAGGYGGGYDRLELATISNNILVGDALFVDSTNAQMALRNYQLQEASDDAIDQGVSVSPYDDQLVAEPDIGPYEYGTPAWTRGAGQMPAGRVATISPTDGAAAESGVDPASYTIFLSEVSDANITIPVTYSGTAQTSDFQTKPFAVIVPAGELSVSLPIQPTDDELIEESEIVTVSLGIGMGYSLGSPASANITIADDDTPIPVIPSISIVASDATATEAGVTTGGFTITRSPVSGAALTVHLTWSGTVGGSDVLTRPSTAIISASQTSVEVIVTPVNDLVYEGDELVIASIDAHAGYTVGSPASASISLIDNEVPADPVVTISASDATASESGSATGVFTITRNPVTASAQTIAISWSGSAVGGDVLSLPATTTIAANMASATVTVTPLDDAVYEGSETLVATVSDGTGYTVGSPASATVTIADNDLAPVPVATIAASDATATEEGPTTGSFLVTLSIPAPSDLSVRIAFTGTAGVGDMSVLPTGVTFNAGSTTANVTVSPIQDSVSEDPETVIATLQPDDGYTIGSNSNAMITITDGAIDSPADSVSDDADDDKCGFGSGLALACAFVAFSFLHVKRARFTKS